MIKCTGCGLNKPASAYYEHKKRGTLYTKCKTCHAARMAAWNGTEKGQRIRKESQWRQRGIQLTLEEYEVMYALQEGKCKTCGRYEPTSGKLLAVDHDHSTGEIRGLLCTKCNTTIGWLELHPQIFTYLTESR